MKRKLPLDAAFDFYVSLGVGRSYQAVATHFKASKVAVTNLATKQGWQQKLVALEAKSREKREQKVAESLDQVHERHLTAARVIQAKALEALKMMRLEDAMDAVRALDMGLKQERLLLGEPTDRTAVEIGEIVRRETSRWLVAENGEKTDGALERDAG
jgi:hypothetical protein